MASEICDFCWEKKKSNDDREILVEAEARAGGKLHICQSCIRICNEIVARKVRLASKKRK